MALVATAVLIQVVLIAAFFTLKDGWPISALDPSRELQLNEVVGDLLQQGLHYPGLLLCVASISLWLSVFLLRKFVVPATLHPVLLLPVSAVVSTLLAVALALLAFCAFIAVGIYLLLAGGFAAH